MITRKKARTDTISVVSSDILSSLPPEIKGDILSRLNVEEAVRTSTLSSTWRDAWTDMPKISMHDGNFPRTKFVTLVDMVLSLHTGTIQEFHISGNKNYHDEFARWMLMLSRRSPRSLIIKLNSGPRYKITSCLFFIGDLEFLRLENCITGFSQVLQGFQRLTDLGLKNFSSTDMDIQNLISFYTELTHLRLTSFVGIKCLNIQAHKLKYLDVDGDFEDINLDAPNLERAVLSLDQEAKVYQSVPIVHGKQSLGCLSEIKKLAICGFFLKYLSKRCIRTMLPSVFTCLENISLMICFWDQRQVLTACSLFEKASNLVHLEMWSYPWSTCDQDQASIQELTVQMQMDHLATASVNGFGGLECEVNFVAKLLSLAPALEEAKIERKGKTECTMLLAKLLALPRACPRAKVIVT